MLTVYDCQSMPVIPFHPDFPVSALATVTSDSEDSVAHYPDIKNAKNCHLHVDG